MQLGFIWNKLRLLSRTAGSVLSMPNVLEAANLGLLQASGEPLLSLSICMRATTLAPVVEPNK